MKPAIALPFNDPDGTMFHHLQAILPDLKGHFERAYLCPLLSTQVHEEHMCQLQEDDFFVIFPVNRELDVGECFSYLYQRSAESAHPDQIVHLAYLDRLAFALGSEYRDATQLKRERENSLAETNKRLNYILPMIEMLTRYARNGRNK